MMIQEDSDGRSGSRENEKRANKVMMGAGGYSQNDSIEESA